MPQQKKMSDDKPKKELPGDPRNPKEKRVKERASNPERPANQDPQFDPSHIQK